MDKRWILLFIISTIENNFFGVFNLLNQDVVTTENMPSLSMDERIIWSGKPKKSAYIATKSLTMLPIAILWLIIDSGFIASSISAGELLFFIIPFFALHLTPVWIWLANFLTARKRWKNTTYFVTNKRIIVQTGFFAVNETTLFYKDLRNVQMHIGFLDKIFKTGDICFDETNGKDSGCTFEDLSEAKELYNHIQNIIMDMQSDISYPNALRPEENPGYKTDYKD